jgi:hypothetical protein
MFGQRVRNDAIEVQRQEVMFDLPMWTLVSPRLDQPHGGLRLRKSGLRGDRLKALRAGQMITFEDRPSPYEWIQSKSKHIVVCEEGEDLSQVIAAKLCIHHSP